MFEAVIRWFIYLSLGLSLLQLYLRANKIWKRKDCPEVALSQSVLGLSLLLVNCILWVFYYFVQGDYSSIIDTSIIMAEASVFLLVSTGFWVPGKKRKFWTSFKNALNFEKKETEYLLNLILGKHSPREIFEILRHLAFIDNVIDYYELKILKDLAERWRLDITEEQILTPPKVSSNGAYIKLQEMVTTLLVSQPSSELIAEMLDLFEQIISADRVITPEEELISAELRFMMQDYLYTGTPKDKFNVLVVPQHPAHKEAVLKINPEAEEVAVAGGVAYIFGTYYSKSFADMMCETYRNLNFFTIIHNENNIKENSQ